MEWAISMITQYGYIAIFALLALGIIGLPVPDEIIMVFVGYLSSIMVLNYSVSILVSFIGAMTGMMISYTLGKKLGQPLVDKHGKWVGLTPKRFAKVKGWFARFGLWTILFGYLFQESDMRQAICRGLARCLYENICWWPAPVLWYGH